MNKYQNPMLGQSDAPASGPKWVPIKQDWPWITGAAIVAGLTAGLVYMGAKDKKK